MAGTTGNQYIELPDPLHFEWDPDKNQSNLFKHGMDFPRGASAFADPARVIKQSGRPHAVEERLQLFGCSSADPTEVITVLFTIRGGRIRIFSVRKAGRDERREYGLR